MTKFHIHNQTKYDGRSFAITRMNGFNMCAAVPFKNNNFDTDYTFLTFNVNGFHLSADVGSCGYGSFYLRNDGLYSNKGKISSWWKFSVSIKDLGIIDTNM